MQKHPKTASLQEFEKIYHFETINPSSVRKITPQKEPKEIAQEHHGSEPALTLFPSTSQLFLEKEPLESLQLSPFAMKALKGFSIETIGQLRDILAHKSETLRSIGQGHLDELDSKVTLFFGRLQSKNAPPADLASLVRFVLSPLSTKDRAKVALLHGLKPFCCIALGDEKEAESFVRHLNEKTKDELTNSLQKQLIHKLQEAGALLFSTYIQQKLAQLGGIASKETLSLLLFADSGLSCYTQFQIIDKFFSIVSRSESTPWYALNGFPVGSHFIAASLSIANEAEQVLEYAETLKKLSKNKPSMQEVTRLLWKKQALCWQVLDIRAIQELLFWNEVYQKNG